MERTITATELVRRLGDILGRIRFRGEAFTVERHGTPVATIGPVPGARVVTLRDAAAAWLAGGSDTDFADDLDKVNAADRPATDPWAS